MVIDFNAKQNAPEPSEPEPTRSSKPEKKQKPGKPQKPAKDQSKSSKTKQMNFKSLIQQMVPYTSAAYIEHVLRVMNVESNQKVSVDSIDSQIPILVEAAGKLRDLVKDIESNEDGLLKGFIVYREETKEEL